MVRLQLCFRKKQNQIIKMLKMIMLFNFVYKRETIELYTQKSNKIIPDGLFQAIIERQVFEERIEHHRNGE